MTTSSAGTNMIVESLIFRWIHEEKIFGLQNFQKHGSRLFTCVLKFSQKLRDPSFIVAFSWDLFIILVLFSKISNYSSFWEKITVFTLMIKNNNIAIEKKIGLHEIRNKNLLNKPDLKI